MPIADGLSSREHPDAVVEEVTGGIRVRLFREA